MGGDAARSYTTITDVKCAYINETDITQETGKRCGTHIGDEQNRKPGMADRDILTVVGKGGKKEQDNNDLQRR